MLRFLSDENFHGDVVRGLLIRHPSLDLVRAQDVGLAGTDDPAVLAWAANEDRILLTHDRATMPVFAHARSAAGAAMPGVFVLNDRLPVREAIDELSMIDACSDHAEWAGRVVHLPL